MVLAAIIRLNAGVFGSLDNALMHAAADPAYLGRVTFVVMLSMVGLAPLSYPLGISASLGPIAMASDAVRRVELFRIARRDLAA
ncbi:hypothetical protein ACF1B0_25950 [Streptomyces anandii]|uniref:hypothetical protein n=1 Tax=Streptomyces anandii TaxID=285454 RepID=UPI0036FC27E8